MEYTIAPSDDGKFILIKTRGNITRHDAMKQNLEAHALGRRLQIDRYLLDVTEARNRESTIDNYEFAYCDMRQADEIDKSARVALLVSPDDHSHDFIAVVSSNAGLAVKIFTDYDQARRFLTE